MILHDFINLPFRYQSASNHTNSGYIYKMLPEKNNEFHIVAKVAHRMPDWDQRRFLSSIISFNGKHFIGCSVTNLNQT